MGSYLTFIKNVRIDKHNKTIGLYRCQCGTEKEISNGNAKSGKTISCGCYRKKMKTNLKHGLTKHPLYSIWGSIIGRCNNENDPDYKNYGGRGVRICDEWRTDFKLFHDWCIINGWRKGKEVDKDKKGDGLLYSPETCSIITRIENCNAKRNNTYLYYNGETKTYAQWSRQYNLKRTILRDRLLKGWDIKDALTYPVKKKGGAIGRNRYKRSISYSFGYIN